LILSLKWRRSINFPKTDRLTDSFNCPSIGAGKRCKQMRSDSLLLTLALLLVWESAIPAQGRGAPESGGSSALAPDAAHLKFKPAEWRSLNDRQIVTRPLAGGHPKEIAGLR
jgi:hypothetical protein